MNGATLDLAELLASDWPSRRYRAALQLLATLHKVIPALPSEDPDDPRPFDVDWSELEAVSAPWSTTERIRVDLARSIADGPLGDAAERLDDVRWSALIGALYTARGVRNPGT